MDKNSIVITSFENASKMPKGDVIGQVADISKVASLLHAFKVSDYVIEFIKELGIME